MSLASAQFLRPSVDVPDAVYQSAQSTDAAAAQLRIDRLENQMRSMTGQIEEMQFQIRRLEDQLRKFQQDVDFRFDEQKGGKPPGGARPTPQAPAPTAPATPPRRTDLNETGYPIITQAAPAPATEPALAEQPKAALRAPGASRDLATMAPGANASAPRTVGLPSGPLEAVQAADPDAPPDLTRRLLAPASRAAAVDPAATASLQAPSRSGPAPQVIPAPAGAPDDPLAEPPAQVASLPQPSPADDYDVATAALKEGRYDVAEQRFRSYLDQHPKDRLTPEAMFHLGESFFRRSRPREAAEQYLKVTVDFPRAARAPEALVKLGLSLEKLGAVEQACAAFGEVARKYPAAPSAVRVSAARESKRVQC